VSQENVEVVRRVHEAYEGHDVIAAMRVGLERLGPDPQPDALVALSADDPLLRHVHPDIEWDAPLPGVSAAHGYMGLLRWWGEWLEVWQSYTIRILEYRDLGDWVMTVNDIHAVGRDGIPLELTNVQMWQVRDGKIARVRIFFDTPEEVEAVGLEE
jgi:ketosteroid isomerase-like protein